MNKRIRRGSSLIEVMVASGMTILIIGAAIATMLSGMRSWAQGESFIEAELDGHQAVKRISQEIREAVALSVSPDGRSISYQLPLRDPQGDFIVPAQSDGVNRIIYVSGNTRNRFDLFIGPVANPRLISRNVILTDPSGVGNPAYRPFIAGPGAVTREVTVLIVTQTASVEGRPITHRVRENIYLRNIPSTTR